jgi:Aldo/keto reductase family
VDYRPLGRTGVQVSKLCLGTMMFGAWGNTDHDDSIRIVHRALDAGVNFVDTADVYSAGESEEIVEGAQRPPRRRRAGHRARSATSAHRHSRAGRSSRHNRRRASGASSGFAPSSRPTSSSTYCPPRSATAWASSPTARSPAAGCRVRRAGPRARPAATLAGSQTPKKLVHRRLVEPAPREGRKGADREVADDGNELVVTEDAARPSGLIGAHELVKEP